jgi:hypothetical protein
MSADPVSRVHYEDGQCLYLRDFASEQTYHVAMRRRHNTTGHTWGVVYGLTLSVEGAKVSVLPGYAVDGFGRELVLRESLPLDQRTITIDGQHSSDVWLYYSRTLNNKGVSPDQSCQSWDEQPQVLVTPAEPGDPDPDHPQDVSDCDLQFDPAIRVPPEKTQWPVFLARVTPDPWDKKNKFTVDARKVRYAGVRAATVEHPDGQSKLTLGHGTLESPHFAVGITGAPEPSLKVIGDDLFIVGELHVTERLDVVRGAVTFPHPIEVDEPRPWQMYCYQQSNGNYRDLRVELPAEKDKKAEFVIGAWSSEEKKFQPCLTVSADRTVTVEGTLVVRGRLEGYAGGGNLSEDENLPPAMAATLATDPDLLQSMATCLVTHYRETAQILADVLAVLLVGGS